jgi:two-component system sensor histidine kinase/response regulator
MINGNRKLLQHCFDSLLENAIEFSEVGSLIILRYTIHDSGIEYEVIDEGSGFSEMAINNLYKFFAPGGQHVDQNAGLALALAKMTMDAHQGTIQAANNPGKGATVKLNFIL